jgi:hypothetical protein
MRPFSFSAIGFFSPHAIFRARLLCVFGVRTVFAHALALALTIFRTPKALALALTIFRTLAVFTLALEIFRTLAVFAQALAPTLEIFRTPNALALALAFALYFFLRLILIHS